jgi:SagB-type dehydrogenase family enzyme
MANDYLEAARVFHEITKHSYTSVRSSPHFLDWNTKPLLYKIYPDAAAIALPRDFKLSQVPALHAILHEPSSQSVPRRIGLENLTHLLFSAGGLTRKNRVGGEEYYFRAAASAGALYPIEIYLAAGDVEGLEPALYHFSPADLKLRLLRRGDWRAFITDSAGNRLELYNTPAIMLLTSIFWRSTWKYRARGYRYCFWDAGMVLANLAAAASAEEIAVSLITNFVDEDLESLLGVDGRREGVVALATLGTCAGPIADSPTLEPFHMESIPLSSQETEYDSLIKIHAESGLLDRNEVKTVTAASLEPPELARSPAPGAISRFETSAPLEALTIDQTILRRGSTRVFAHAALPARELATILATSRVHPTPADFPPLTDTYLIVNAVEGLASGAYHYRCELGDFELLKPGEFRIEAGYLCLEQRLGADCAALVVYMTDLERVLRALGNRGYRDAHLEAGVLGGRAYLAAYALGRGATGLTFYDDDTTDFFAPHAAGKSPLLMVALGVPRSQRLSEETR